MSQIHSMSVASEDIQHPSRAEPADGSAALCDQTLDEDAVSLVRPEHFRALMELDDVDTARSLLCDHCIEHYLHEEEIGEWP